MNRFHYIIAGAGCAGLSFLVRLLQTGHFSDKKILLIDKSPKTQNDRTWCFWEKGPGLFEPVVYKTWDQVWFYGKDHEALHAVAPYQYKMIRGLDFYRYCLNIIQQYPNVVIEYGAVKRIENEGAGAVLETDQQLYYADHIFSSILLEPPVLKKKQYHLLQHFKGWVIETAQPIFNPAQATLMDFRISQQQGTAFVYVMPFASNKALVEYTLFTDRLLELHEYDFGLKEYIHHFLLTKDYVIKEEEFGVIPMTNYRYEESLGKITYLGTAGGQTKASSGYTFQFIQKQTAQLVDAMLTTGKPTTHKGFMNRRFKWYDATLLNILSQHKLPGSFIFTELFKKNNIIDIFQFLDNETSVLQEMKIITVLPKKIFIKAALQQLL
jgi:lycopene beta-cyclase